MNQAGGQEPIPRRVADGDPQVAPRPTEALPASWEACQVFAFTCNVGHDRMYTTSVSESQVLHAAKSRKSRYFHVPTWKSEGSRGQFWLKNDDPKYMGPVYRFLNDHHFWTTNETEKDTIGKDGWNDEGIVGFLVLPDKIEDFRKAYNITSGVTWYRRFADHDHFYTTNDAEAKNVLSSGFKDEGALGYLY
jgi:hypothetical protein